MGEEVCRRLAAILAADVVGYSRLMGEDEAGTLAAVRTHLEELIAPKIAEHEGRIVKEMGDGLLAEFPSAVKAVQCAVVIQKKMPDRNKIVPTNRRIIYRIGINIGDIILENDDIFGDGVIVAARLEGLAQPGGICISGNVYEQLAGKTDFSFKDAGQQVFKNIAKPVSVWRWVAQATEQIHPELSLPDISSRAVGSKSAGRYLKMFALYFDLVESRRASKKADRAEFNKFLITIDRKIDSELKLFESIDYKRLKGDDCIVHFADPVSAIHAAIHLVDNHPLWCKEIGGSDEIYIRAAVQETTWVEGELHIYDETLAKSGKVVGEHNMPNDCLAVEDTVLDAAMRDPRFKPRTWLHNDIVVDIDDVGRAVTYLRPGRTRLGSHKIEGAVISLGGRCFVDELQGRLVPDLELKVDSKMRREFTILKAAGKLGVSPYHGVHVHLVGPPVIGDHDTLLNVAKSGYAHHILPLRSSEMAEHVRKQAEDTANNSDWLRRRSSDELVGLLGARDVISLGVQIVFTTSDCPPKMLLMRRSKGVTQSAEKWDVSVSGYTLAKDVDESHGNIDFWRTAEREAETELNLYSLELRNLVFHCLYYNFDIDSVDLIGHYESQQGYMEFAPYLKKLVPYLAAYEDDATRRPMERQMAGTEYAWVDATPSGVASFCRKNGICFGGSSNGSSELMPGQSAYAIVCALRSLGHSEPEIVSELEVVCQQNP